MLNPVAMSIITNTFTDPRERAQAVGVWGAVFGISMALGPVVGGALVSAIGWRSIFWINVPVGLAAIALTLRFIPESRAPRPRRFDPVGQVLVIVLLATLTFGIIEAPSRGWTSPVIVAAFAAAARRWSACCSTSRAASEPLIDLRFFRSIPFASAIVDLGRRVRRVRRLPVPEHALPAGRARPLAGAGRAGHRAAGADDGGRVAAVGAHRRPPRAAAAARDRRRLHGDRVRRC